MENRLTNTIAKSEGVCDRAIANGLRVFATLFLYVYSCFDKGCPKKRKSVRDNAER